MANTDNHTPAALSPAAGDARGHLRPPLAAMNAERQPEQGPGPRIGKGEHRAGGRPDRSTAAASSRIEPVETNEALDPARRARIRGAPPHLIAPHPEAADLEGADLEAANLEASHHNAADVDGIHDTAGIVETAGHDVAALLADPLFGDDLIADRFDMPALPAAQDPESAVVIARKVADIAQGLAVLAERLGGQPPLAANELAESQCVAFLESLFRIRRLRVRHVAGLIFGEPAWDILLDLTVAQFWRRETSVTSLCIAADVPPTTALRWINNMTRNGMIVRRPCERDGRRSFLAAAPHVYAAMIALAADALRTEQRVRSRYHNRLG